MKRTMAELQKIIDDVAEVDEAKVNRDTGAAKSAAARLGVRFSEEGRRNISEAKIGRSPGPQTEEHRRKIGAANRIALNTNEVRAKLSAVNLGKKMADESKQKLRDRVISDETRVKMSAAAKARTQRPSPNKGKHLSVEQRQKLSQTLKGRQVSEESRQKLSEALKAAHVRKRKLREDGNF